MCCFLKFSITGRLETHRNDFFFIFSLSRPFPTYFGLERSYDSVFWFFEFYCYFFGIFYYESGRSTSERFFFSLNLSLSQPILARKEAMIVFSNFLNFFAIFFEIFYFGSGRNPSERLFLFSLFFDLSHPILVWKEAMIVFSNFLNFFVIFLEFFITSRVGAHHSDFIFF